MEEQSQTPETEVFDKAKWHFGADNFPSELDAYQGYIHTGYYVGWLIRKGFLDTEEELDMSPVAFYRDKMDGVLTAEDVIPEVLSFTREYFDPEPGKYLKDYEKALGNGLPSIYHVKDTAENFEKIFSIIEESYKKWKNRPFSGKWTGQYTYGDEYPEDMKGTSVPFVIEMDAEGGNVSGKCRDMEGEHLDAIIEGFIQNGYISFIKRYKQVSDEMNFWDIHYYGEYQKGRFAGEWEIEWSAVNEFGEREEYLNTGTWEMQQTAGNVI